MNFFACFGNANDITDETIFHEIIGNSSSELGKLTLNQFCHLSNDDVEKIYHDLDVSIVQKAQLDEIRFSRIQRKYDSVNLLFRGSKHYPSIYASNPMMTPNRISEIIAEQTHKLKSAKKSVGFDSMNSSNNNKSESLKIMVDVKKGKSIKAATKIHLERIQTNRFNTVPLTIADYARNPDFLAIGLGATNMLAMLFAIAQGKSVVGVEIRGDPWLGIHWNIREDLYHQFGLIDQMMVERYGIDRIPWRTVINKPFFLAEVMWSTETTAGDIVPDEVIEGFDDEYHLTGGINDVEFIDDRYKDGKPHRHITILDPIKPPSKPDPSKIRDSVRQILDGPSTYQSGSYDILVLMRRYLEKLMKMDIEAGLTPRCVLFTHHSVCKDIPRIFKGDEQNSETNLKNVGGFQYQPDGRLRVAIEEVTELDWKGKTVRVKKPSVEVIDLGVPELIMIAEGFHSTSSEMLGFEQHDVAHDHGDGRGPIVAQADFAAAVIDILVDGRLRRRISSYIDKDGNEQWLRQIAVGHEGDPEVGWILVQVPNDYNFDPIKAGIVDENTPEDSPEYFAAHQKILFNFYSQQAAKILDIPVKDIHNIRFSYGPKLFTLVERIGDDALIAPNCVVAGDSFGNGHFLTSGGAMTGMIGHAYRVFNYFNKRDAGTPTDKAIRELADRIKKDTEDWLAVSQTEFSQALPINFGAERVAQIAEAAGIDVTRRDIGGGVVNQERKRHGLIALDPSDWRRLYIRPGVVYSNKLPPLSPIHPHLRPDMCSANTAQDF